MTSILEDLYAICICDLISVNFFSNFIIITLVTIIIALRITIGSHFFIVVVDLPLLRVTVEGSDNPIALEKPCQASLPPDQQGHHSRETSRGPVCCLRYIGVCS